jgi:NAD(P)-dependent dehydrogenase (short-subunit alcohol dehydrogenase family)
VDRLKDKVALVTAAAPGMGPAAAHVFARERASFVVTGIRKDLTVEVGTRITDQGGTAIGIELDATKPEHWNADRSAAPRGAGRRIDRQHVVDRGHDRVAESSPWILGVQGSQPIADQECRS